MQELPRYNHAPEPIPTILNVPPTPLLTLSPSRDRVLLVQGVRYPPVAELAEPMLKLAGIRVNPRTNARYRAPQFVGLTLKMLPDGDPQELRLPSDPHLGFPVWSSDGKRFAFTNTTPVGVELWTGDSDTGELRAYPDIQLNAARGGAQWMPDSHSLLCSLIPEGRGPAPEPPAAPSGPNIQESTGRESPVRTYPDVLQTPYDELLFEHYFTSQLALIEIGAGRVRTIGPPGVFGRIQVSPDGEHLLVSRTVRPYSYLLYADSFPREVEVWSQQGDLEYRVASLPLAEHVPIEGVPTGPRGVHWHPVKPAALFWVEALDDGDPRKTISHRDRVLTLSAPFSQAPDEFSRTEHRYAGLSWTETGADAFLSDYDRDRRWVRTWVMAEGREPRLVWDRSVKDRYGDPGDLLNVLLENGKIAVREWNGCVYLSGQGATPVGDRPFLDRMRLLDFEKERLFQSSEGTVESLAALLSVDASSYITRCETQDEPPNYFIRSSSGDAHPITAFQDPAPQLRSMQKELVTYEREDGVPLSFTLYRPPGYQQGKRLPLVVWAYPQEFNDPATAGQVVGSPHRFTSLIGPTHLFFLSRGYAILDNPSLPVIGDPATMNDTFVEQVVSGASAAIKKAADMGVGDPERVGVGGHSYGAFMTANLMAHSDLFRAGIARSGAYNRTLTPFGFQSERRTLWEASEAYIRMSPLLYAHQIKRPILFIHGEADNNPGTQPIQTERMYQAVKGTGGIARLVMLPHESHAYESRESVEHVLHEMISWFDRYVMQGASEARE